MGTLTSAYKQLGITINSGEARSAWSAIDEENQIVALTIWTDELQREKETGVYFLDTSCLREEDRGAWREKQGNLKRMRHLRKALKWGGKVRIVKVRPGVGDTYEERHTEMKSADPWLYKGSPIEAQLVFFDGVDFRVEVDPTAVGKTA